MTLKELYWELKVALRIWIPVEKYQPSKRYDWVLVRVREVNTGWLNPLPYIAERSRVTGEWHFRGVEEHTSNYGYIYGDNEGWLGLDVVSWRRI